MWCARPSSQNNSLLLCFLSIGEEKAKVNKILGALLVALGAFEQAHKLLGELLGYEAGKEESDGSPDPWWISGKRCFVFEDHAGAEEDSALNVEKARQSALHPNWMKENLDACAGADIMSLLVTPVKKVRKRAVVHLEGVALWPLQEFRAWAERALAIVRQLRSSFVEPGNLIWRAQAAGAFEQGGLDASSLATSLEDHSAKKELKVID